MRILISINCLKNVFSFENWFSRVFFQLRKWGLSDRKLFHFCYYFKTDSLKFSLLCSSFHHLNPLSRLTIPIDEVQWSFIIPYSKETFLFDSKPFHIDIFVTLTIQFKLLIVHFLFVILWVPWGQKSTDFLQTEFSSMHETTRWKRGFCFIISRLS